MSSGTLVPELSGSQIEKSFSYYETPAGEVDVEAIRNIVTNGHHEGAVVYVVRDAFSPEAATSIVENFDRLTQRTGGGNRQDDSYVKTHQIGATQFSYSGEEYVREVIKSSSESLELFDNVSQEELERVFLTKLLEKTFAEQGVVFRGSRYKNISGGFATLRRWLDNGEMALHPHDDTAQLLAAVKDDYEIATSRHVVSFNAAVQVAEEGGELVVWNLNPDDDCRAGLGLTGTGYPYPIGTLTGLESFTVELGPRDVYFLNASFIHGVASVRKGQRLSAGRFIGQVADDLVVYWT
ncbi:hypothetical protein GCM10022223_62280 [Kineosporia mesophila]|uniref:Fe2OG dioxygenase domain-containing protein n=1 Tax=Kineosporia mesophila TaxID=566012 RepID=A0ABP7AM41_9ACTN|nr:hypothetical protein [Kineosporia mesophila]MCD5353963.1 hypothetical protein [Kineosporia mesophila]